MLAALGNSPSRAQLLNVASETNPAGGLVFRSWGTEAGLPQNTVNAIVQTRDGYLWIGTSDGLARFDGVRFTVFGLQEGLPSVVVQTLYEDRLGTLWIGTSGGGLSRRAAGRIENVSLPQYLVASGTVTSLAADAAGRLWIGTPVGLAIWDHERFTQLEELMGLGRSGIRALWYDRSGGMWIATPSQGLYEFRDNRLSESVELPGSERIRAHCLFEDASTNLWVSIGDGTVLCRHDGQWRRFTETNGLPFAYVTCLAEESGTLWAGSDDDGLYCFKAGRFFAIRKQQGLSANDIRSLCPDREGNLWVGTRTGGLDRLSRRKVLSYGAAQGLTNDYTRSVAQTADGQLWVGTSGSGLCRVGPEGCEYRCLAPAYSFVESVLAAKDGSLWWGAGAGLFCSRDGKLAGSYTNQVWLGRGTVTALCEDARGGLWAGTSAGRLMHFQDGVFTEVQETIAQGPVTGLAQEPAGPLWVGSMAGGLKRINPGNGTCESVTNGLPSQAIRTLYLDGQGTLWIGTAGGGLSCCRNGRITTFTAREGFSASTVVQIVEDDYGFLWLGTTHGVLRIRKPDLEEEAAGKLSFLQPRAFGIYEGMPAEECSSGFCPAGLKTKGGPICISTVKGLAFFDPRRQATNSPPPKVLLEEVLANGQVREPVTEETGTRDTSGDAGSQSPPTARQITLAPGSRELEIRYTGISFGAPDKLRFRYQLKGLDPGWVEAADRRSAYYPHLPAGKFLFRVLACNADGVWSANGPALAVTVEPYVWQATWFQAMALVAALGVMAGAVRLLERRRYRRRLALIEARHAVERERLRISQDMHDDIGSVLTQVSQLSDFGQSEAGNAAAAKGHFELIGNRARAAVQALDEIVWATNPKNDTLPRFAEYVCRFADEMFRGGTLRCWLDVPTSLPTVLLGADTRHNVLLALKEAFNNALKHSGATEVWLRLSLQNSEVCVSVEDNGHGFERDRIGPGGNGLENMKTRLAPVYELA